MAKGFVLKIPDELHTNIKVTAFTKGMTMMEYMLGVLAKEFSTKTTPKKAPKGVSTTAGTSPSVKY